MDAFGSGEGVVHFMSCQLALFFFILHWDDENIQLSAVKICNSMCFCGVMPLPHGPTSTSRGQITLELQSASPSGTARRPVPENIGMDRTIART